MKSVIVGGGIGGLSLARELALRGVKATVLERAPEPSDARRRTTARAGDGVMP